MIYNRMRLAKTLAAIRKNRGFTQEAAAVRMEMSRTSYSEMETGRRALSVEDIVKCMNLYRVTFYDLVENDVPVWKLSKRYPPNIYDYKTKNYQRKLPPEESGELADPAK